MRILISDQNFGDAAKPAVVETTEVLAIEWAEQAVQVKAIGPSTEFVDKGSATAYRLVEPAEPPWLFTSGAAFSPLSCRLRAAQCWSGHTAMRLLRTAARLRSGARGQGNLTRA